MRGILLQRRCLECKVIFDVTSQNHTKVFCSRNCVDKNRNKGKFIICFNCGLKKWYPTNRWKRNKSGRFFCSRLCSFRYLKGRMALYPVNYQIRRLHNYTKWRTDVFKRDGYTCKNCNKRGEKLNADHIIPLSFIFRKYKIKTIKEALLCDELWDVSNGRTLCEPCHKLTSTWGYKALYYVEN